MRAHRLRTVFDVERLLLLESSAMPHAGNSAVRVRPCRPEDDEVLGPVLPPGLIPGGLARGDIGLVAELDGGVVGCIWATGHAIRTHKYRVPVQPADGELYAYGLVVLSNVRKQRIGSILRRAIVTETQRRGTRLLSHVSTRNAPMVHMRLVATDSGIREEVDVLVLAGRFGVTLRRRRVSPARAAAIRAWAGAAA